MHDIYLVRQHVQVGEELILTAFVDAPRSAEKLAKQLNRKSGTVNFDVVYVQEGEIREELGGWSRVDAEGEAIARIDRRRSRK